MLMRLNATKGTAPLLMCAAMVPSGVGCIGLLMPEPGTGTALIMGTDRVHLTDATDHNHLLRNAVQLLCK